MELFNGSSLFSKESIENFLAKAGNKEELYELIIQVKKSLMTNYNFKEYNLPEDFFTTPSVIATNHLTDSDAPLIMSLYYKLMEPIKTTYPQLFVFAKENCFNGVSIPKELLPILEREQVCEVNRNSKNGAMQVMKTAKKWFNEGEVPKHFLIFAQGTIYDINKENVIDIEDGAFWLARMLGIPVLPAFIEQAVEGEDNRIVFGDYIQVPKTCRDFTEYKQIWLDRVLEAQNSFEKFTGTKARETVLDEAHQTRKYQRGVPADMPAPSIEQ